MPHPNIPGGYTSEQARQRANTLGSANLPSVFQAKVATQQSADQQMVDNATSQLASGGGNMGSKKPGDPRQQAISRRLSRGRK